MALEFTPASQYVCAAPGAQFHDADTLEHDVVTFLRFVLILNAPAGNTGWFSIGGGSSFTTPPPLLPRLALSLLLA